MPRRVGRIAYHLACRFQGHAMAIQLRLVGRNRANPVGGAFAIRLVPRRAKLAPGIVLPRRKGRAHSRGMLKPGVAQDGDCNFKPHPSGP